MDPIQPGVLRRRAAAHISGAGGAAAGGAASGGQRGRQAGGGAGAEEPVGRAQQQQQGGVGVDRELGGWQGSGWAAGEKRYEWFHAASCVPSACLCTHQPTVSGAANSLPLPSATAPRLTSLHMSMCLAFYSLQPCSAETLSLPWGCAAASAAAQDC